METIKDFNELSDRLQSSGRRYRVAAVEVTDPHSSEAIERAESEGWAEVTRLHLDTVEASANEAVSMIHRGEADVIMKGIINTDVLLRAILNKEQRLVPKGNVLTHISAMDIPGLQKLLFMMDPAVIPYPTLEQRTAMIRYAVSVCGAYGIEEPRIALIHCTEKVSEKFPLTLDYVSLKDMCQRGELGRCIVDGPMDLRCAIDPEAMQIKHMESPIAGEADVVIMPDIEAANVFYKTITAFTAAHLAVGLQGAQCPITLTSRADETDTKYNSLAMACLQVPNR